MTSIHQHGSRIDSLVRECRRGVARVEPHELDDWMSDGALVVDTRPADQRLCDGPLPGSVVVDRNVLEWRLDPTSTSRSGWFDDIDQVIVVVCNEGYSSTLAAWTLRQLGLRNATDLAGGFQAWLRWCAKDGRQSHPAEPRKP